jgi:RNA polymerase sigma factor (sigma-70 family)
LKSKTQGEKSPFLEAKMKNSELFETLREVILEIAKEINPILFTSFKEDLLQEVYLHCYKALPFFDQRCKLNYYLFVIVRKGIDNFRGTYKLRQYRGHKEDYPYHFISLFSDITKQEAKEIKEKYCLEDQEASLEASYLLEKLPERKKQITSLYFGINCQPKTLKEIGLELGVSDERVRQILVETLLFLRNSIKDEEDS